MVSRLGLSVVPCLPFLGEGSPTKIDKHKVPTYSNLSTIGGPSRTSPWSRLSRASRFGRIEGVAVLRQAPRLHLHRGSRGAAGSGTEPQVSRESKQAQLPPVDSAPFFLFEGEGFPFKLNQNPGASDGFRPFLFSGPLFGEGFRFL